MRPAVILLLCVAAMNAQAADLFKCTDATGRVSYQDIPCEAGKKAAGQIQRDRRAADPDALLKAAADRDRSQKLSQQRAAEYAASEAKRIDEANRAREQAEAEARADARAAMMAAPQPAPNVYIQPTKVVVLPPPKR